MRTGWPWIWVRWACPEMGGGWRGGAVRTGWLWIWVRWACPEMGGGGGEGQRGLDGCGSG